MNMPNLNEEKKLWKKGFKCVVGLDEAGRGPLAGPVVAAAIIISPKLKIKNLKLKINDSKQLSAKQREETYKIIIKHPGFKWGIGRVSEKIIDKINILEATKLAMLRAIDNLESKERKNYAIQKLNDRPISVGHVYLLIDGNFRLKTKIPQKSIIKGDQKVFSISAASIIAKVTRDRIMLKYDKKYPEYGFKKHKGYPTLLHRNILREIGPCLIHRKSFIHT